MNRIWLYVAALALVGAACGADDGAAPAASSATSVPTTTIPQPTTSTSEPITTTSSAVPDTGFPVTITTPAGDVTIEAKPGHIVSLSATATESLFAIGAGGQVIAVDDASNYPEDVPRTDLNGFTVTAESVAAYDPDLVVYFFDPGDLAAGLDAIGIPALYQPAAATLDEALDQIEQLGMATGHGDLASSLSGVIEADIGDLYGPVNDAADVTYYYELDQSFFSVTSETFVGGLFAPLGLVNIADPADTDGFGYPQLSAEFIVAEDPGLIFLADTKCCGQDASTVAERPGWAEMSAVKWGGVVELDDDIASRWGPRIVDLVRAAADAVADR